MTQAQKKYHHEYNKRYYQANKARMDEAHKAYHQAHKDDKAYIAKRAEATKAYHHAHKDDKAYIATRKASFKQWHNNHKEEQTIRLKEWRANNPDKVKASLKRQQAKSQKVLHAVKVAYGCLNPDCCWHGDLKPCALDFHHLKKKSFNIGSGIGIPLERLAHEINKCTVLCAVCHRYVSAKQLDDTHFPQCKVNKNLEIS